MAQALFFQEHGYFLLGIGFRARIHYFYHENICITMFIIDTETRVMKISLRLALLPPLSTSRKVQTLALPACCGARA
jgi:hypothetical protein